MICDEFLSRYSEFLDDRLPLPMAAEMRRHLRECGSCGRYHRVMTEGRRQLRALPYMEPSSAFYVGLRARLAATEPSSRTDVRGGGSGALATLSIAALIALIAWSALLDPEAPTIELPAMAARPPAPEVWWRVPASGPRLTPAAAWRAGWWSWSGGEELRPSSVPGAVPRGSDIALFAPGSLYGVGAVPAATVRSARTTFE